MWTLKEPINALVLINLVESAVYKTVTVIVAMKMQCL